MIFTCLSEARVKPDDAVIVGDTAYDMEMGKAAGIHALGVAWGYHGRGRLESAGADAILDDFGGLWPWLAKEWRLM